MSFCKANAARAAALAIAACSPSTAIGQATNSFQPLQIGSAQFQVVAGADPAPAARRTATSPSHAASFLAPTLAAMDVKRGLASDLDRAAGPSARTADTLASMIENDLLQTASIRPRSAAPSLEPQELPLLGGENVRIISARNALLAEAVRRARNSLEQFQSAVGQPSNGASGFAVKVAIGSRDARESVWLTSLERTISRKFFIFTRERWSGQLSEAPAHLKGYRAGDRVGFDTSEIRDWTYKTAEGRTMGNFTACAVTALDGREKLDALVQAQRLDCRWVEGATVSTLR